MRQIAAAPDEARQALVVDGGVVELAALAAEPQAHAALVDARVAIAQRREAERIVLLGVALVADAQARGLEQPQIQTSVHAGGIASALMRASVRSDVMRRPRASR